MKTKKLLSWYFSTFLKKFWVNLIIVSILFIGAELITICYFLFIKPLVDTAVYTKEPLVLMRWGIIYMGVIVLNFFLNMFKRILFSRLKLKIEQVLREYFYNNSLNLPVAFIFSKQSGYILQRILKDVEGSMELINDENFVAVGQVLSAVFLLWALISLNLKLTLIGLTTYPLFILNLYFIAPRIRPWAKKVQESYAQLGARVQETLQGINTIRTFSLENNEKALFASQLYSYLKVQWDYFLRHIIFGSGIPLLLYLPILGLLIWLGINEVMHNSLSVGGFMSFVLLFMMNASAPLRGLSVLASTIQPAVASIERLYEFQQYKSPSVRKKFTQLPTNIECIYFEGIKFSYDDEKYILNDVYLKIPRSKIVAVIGHSGSGKTTLVNLLLGFIKPLEGVIRINNTDLNDIKLEEWLKIIGMMEQDTFIFNRSIYENIRIARLDASKEEIEDAARKAGLLEFIMTLPKGFQTVVGERGFSISGGERQRIAIARIFLKSPEIIIMDEPTSALDKVTEEKIMMELKKLSENKTVLITTHRHSLLEMADFVYEIKNGRIFNFLK